MSASPVFHEYSDWPRENSTLRLPRITESAARETIQGCELVEERGVIGGPKDYTIREYRHLESGELHWLGGVFAGW